MGRHSQIRDFIRESGDRLITEANEVPVMSEQEGDTDRVSVRTYVPRYQRELWDDHAEELDMSRSEYVRTMVQAGRRGFLDEGEDATGIEPSDGDGGEPAAGADLESSVVAALSTGAYRSWDELLAAVNDDVEDRLETTLQELQDEGRVRHSGRNGGYTLDE